MSPTQNTLYLQWVCMCGCIVCVCVCVCVCVVVYYACVYIYCTLRCPSNCVCFDSRYGYVEFTSSKDAQNAMELNGSDLDGRELRVDIATPRRSSGGGNTPRGGGRGTPRGSRGGVCVCVRVCVRERVSE